MSDVLLQNAQRLHQAGNLAEAARLYDEVLKAEPQRFDALYPLGIAYLQRGQFAQAERALAQAAQVNATAAEPHAAHGAALSQLGRHSEALAAYDRAIALKPGHASVWSNRGNALLQLQRFADAVTSYDRALGLKPDYTDAWRHRGLALTLMDRTDEALASFDKAIALKKSDTGALQDKANLLMRLHRHAEAEAIFAKAIALQPANADLHYNRANALSILKQYGESIAECRTTLAIDADYPYARGILIHDMLQCCDWRALDDEKANISTALAAGKRVLSPFNHKALSDSPQAQLRCARVWVANEKPAGLIPFALKTRREGRIRLAYLSGDLNASAVATAMAGVFEHHDKSRFETIAISFGTPAQTPMRMRLEKSFDRFIDMRDRSDDAIATAIREMDIDIAVDLMGYTGECRSWILARRPARLQVNFLGFPGTMGAAHIDYIVADATVVPRDSEQHYAEKIAYLPDCYLPHDATRAIADAPSRREAGLPDKGLVFASFNNTYKFTPAMFDIWMRVLRAVPGSVLWLPKSHPAALTNLLREAEARGVAADRLVFAPLVESSEAHLARFRLADLFLDTLPYNAHSTTMDALWAGLPVLTCKGESFQARVAASLLTAAGLPELIASSAAEYEAMALHFAQAPEALAAIKEKLARNRQHAPIFDTGRFTRHLESAFMQMWKRYSQGERPATFTVSPS
jgi:predicted O-linked N-acetylglucosamine transferase (SPINDLY family)